MYPTAIHKSAMEQVVLFKKKDAPGWKQVDLGFIRKGWAMMTPLIMAILDHKKGPLAEIGMGASSYFLAELAKKYQVKLYSCDIKWGGMWDLYTEKLFDDHICFIGKSEDFIKQFEDEPMVVFIDGQHDYEVIKMEGEFFLDKMPVGGVLLMHDTYPHHEKFILDPDPSCHDVYKFRQDLERNPDIDVLSFPYLEITAGLTMAMKQAANEKRPYWLRNGRVSSSG